MGKKEIKGLKLSLKPNVIIVIDMGIMLPNARAIEDEDVYDDGDDKKNND